MQHRRWAIAIAITCVATALFAHPIDFAAARTARLPDQATVQPTPTLLAGSPITYTVKTGDTFSGIARQFNLTAQQLAALNQITNTNVLKAGQVLIVGITPFTPTPTSSPVPTSSPLPTDTAMATPTGTPTSTATPTEAAATLIATVKPLRATSPASHDIPIDVYLVAGLMVLAVIGIIIGFRLQDR